MKKISIFFVLVLVATTLLVCLGFTSAKPSTEITEPVEKAIAELGVSEGELQFIDQRENIYGDKQLTYSDDTYTYILDAKSAQLVIAMLNTDKMIKLVETAPEITAIDQTKADSFLMSTMEEQFPHINTERISINAITDSGSAIDYIIYEVTEVYENIVVNRAIISYGIDGSLTSFCSTYNKLDDFKESNRFDEAEIKDIVYKYIMSNKESIEKAMLPSKDSGADIKANADDGFVLPDGVKSIDEVVEQKLPEYKLYINSNKDLNGIKMVKEMHRGSVVWVVEFTLNTSWGEVDNIFNSLVHMIIDAKTGEVIEVASTDGGC